MQERQLHLESVLGRMRSVGSNDKWQVGNLAQRLHVDRHAAKRSLEGIDCRSGNPADMEVMCWPDQHNTRDRLRTVPKRCECRGSNAAGIGIACVRRNQCFGHDFRRRREIARAGPEPVFAGDPDHWGRTGPPPLQAEFACESACILRRFRLTTILDVSLKLRPSAT